MSINVNMNVREAITLITSGEISNELCEQIIKAIEEKCGSVTTASGNLNLTLKSFPDDRRIRVIKSIRTNTGWGLKESKEFCDVVSGPLKLNSTGAYSFSGGTPNTLTDRKDIIENLNKELVSLGCETYVDGW